MIKEFKKTIHGQDVVYTLESATSGGTSSGAIATSVGGKKKGGLLVQGSDPAVIRRNPVAKNVNKASSGAGVHKDRKKAMKSGERKHKQPWAEDRVLEGKETVNFDADDIKHLEKINDLETLKAQAFALISKPSKKPMKPEKIYWFKGALDRMENKVQVIKLMYDLYLSGLGHAVIGTKHGMKSNSYREKFSEQDVTEKWSQKYKKSINCSHPKGFSQKAHCAGKKKHNESTTMEMVCPECGMCQTHGNLDEIKKGQKDSNGYTRCWPGKHAVGTKKGKHGGRVRNCVPNESLSESHPGNYGFGSSASNTALKTQNIQHSAESSHDDSHTGEENGMMSSALKSLYKHAAKLRHAVKQMQQTNDTLEPWQQAKVTKAADYLDTVFNSVDDDMDLGEDGETHNGGGNTAVANGGNSRPSTAHKLDKGRGWNNAMHRMSEATTDLDQRISNLELGLYQARNITKTIKYDHTVTEILSEFRALVEKYQLNEKDFSYYAHDVSEAQDALESAVYNLEEVFTDAITALELESDKTYGETISESKRLNEKSKSEKQARTMAAAAHNPKFAKKLGIKQSVAKEFNKADKGTKQLSNAMKHKNEGYVDPYIEALKQRLGERVLEPNDSVEKYIDVFQKANYNQPGNYQFGKYNPENRTKQKRERMAKAASYAAKTRKKK